MKSSQQDPVTSSFVMSLKRREKWFIALFITLLSGFLFLVAQAHYLRNQVATLSQVSQTLSQNNRVLSQKNEQLRYYYDLATEFAIDPMIVTLVDQYAREAMSDNGPEWRLVRTPEFMTYIMLSLIYVESKGNTFAVGDGGKARGLTQLWVSTARQYGDVTPEQLHLPETNISFSFRHFRHLLKKYRGNLALALYAWNRGAGKVDKLLVYGESPQNGYAKKIYEAALLNNRDWLLTSAQ